MSADQWLLAPSAPVHAFRVSVLPDLLGLHYYSLMTAYTMASPRRLGPNKPCS